MNDFGIIVSACDADYLFTKGLCASIRHYLGESVPICLIADGNVTGKEVCQTYGATVIRTADVEDKEIRDVCSGSSFAKMLSFWESPWERFLYLDSDIVLCGDVLKHNHLDEVDMVVDGSGHCSDDSLIGRLYFDKSRLQTLYPSFPTEKYLPNYFNSGAFFGKRHLFSKEEFLFMYRLKKENPDLFMFVDQGLLNLMTFLAVEEGRVRCKSVPMQFFPVEHPYPVQKEEFDFDSRGPKEDVGRSPFLAHWATSSLHKPISLLWFSDFTRPMTFFRMRFKLDQRKRWKGFVWVLILLEDVHFVLTVTRRKICKRGLKGIVMMVPRTLGQMAGRIWPRFLPSGRGQ